ncbi:MAG: sulfatase [Planctomycetota bacterium]
MSRWEPFPRAVPRRRLASIGLWLSALLGAAGCGGDAAEGGSAAGTPRSHLMVDEEALDLVALFSARDPSVSVLAQDSAQPLAAWPFAFIDKEQRLASDANDLVIHARAESDFQVRAGPFPAGARLRVRTMVLSQFRTDPLKADPAPVTFRVLIDGQERLALRSDYILDRADHEHPYDQIMRTIELPLDDFAGRAVELRFQTTRHGQAVPEGVVPAEPLWWELLIVQPRAIARQRTGPGRPNVLVLVVDTLAARRMSLHGYARPTTPELEAFARTGTVFERALSTSSWTLPATASLLTGLPPNTHGVLGDTRSYLMESLSTWPERLRRAGLEGAAFVANALVQPANNFHQGFGHWDQSNDLPACALNERLLAWLDGQPQGERWFAYVHYMDPHAPYGAPGPERTRFAEGYVEQRDFAGFLPNQLQRNEVEPLSAEARQHVVDLYDGEVAWFDACFGDLWRALAARGLQEQTVVLLTSDHGEELFEHGGLGHGYSLHDELLAVPLILAGPGVPAGVRRGEPVSTAAVSATLLTLAGLPPDPDASPSLLPFPPAGRHAAPVFAGVRTQLFGPRRNLLAAQDAEGRKLLLTLADDHSVAGREAFDLRSDPQELLPLDLAARADQADWLALESAALQWYRESAERRPREEQPVNPAMEESLNQVGYTDGKRRDKKQ